MLHQPRTRATGHRVHLPDSPTWRTLLCTDRSAVGMGADFSVARARLYVLHGRLPDGRQVRRTTSWPASRRRAHRRRRRAGRTARPSRVRFRTCRGGMAVVARPVRSMAGSHADAARSNPVVRAHARTIPCGTPRAAVAVNVPQSPFPQIQPRYPMCYSILLTPFPIGSTAVKGPIAPTRRPR